MALQTFPYEDLGGGRNGGAAASQIQQNEMAELKNWYPYATKLRRRGGIRQLTSPWGGTANSLFPLKTADGDWTMIVGGKEKFGKVDGLAIVDLSASYYTPPSLGGTHKPWAFFQYKDHVYALRADSGQLIRIDSSSYARAGISAPSTASVLAAGAAGALAAGDYRSVYTFYNRDTDYESNPSPVSNTLALGANLKIDHFGIGVSNNPFVNARRLYRTVVGQAGMYYFVAQINNNVDTTFIGDNVLPADLGRSVSFNNGLPPSGLELGVIFQERLFASDGTNLMYSEFLKPEMFGSNLLPIFPDDGHVISGLYALGDRLIIGKTNAIHYLVGTDPSNFAVHTLSDRYGVKSHFSMKSAESNLFFYGTGKAVYRSDGTYVKDISTPRVADILADVPDDREDTICGAVLADKNWYLLGVPQSDGKTIVLVYNYKYDSWTTFDADGSGPFFLADFHDENYTHQLYGLVYNWLSPGIFSLYDAVYRLFDETYNLDDIELGFDPTRPIKATFTTKADDFGYPGYRHFFDEVWLLIPQTTGAGLQIEALRDGIGTPDVNRTVSLNVGSPDGWKAFKVPTARTPGTKTQLRVTYLSPAAIDIEQIAFRAGLMGRQSMQAR
jgi:hypothetical protein